MKKKNRGKYQVKKVVKINKEEAAKLVYNVIVKEIKKVVGLI